MSGMLPKNKKDFYKIPKVRVAIISAMWHRDCIDVMVDTAKSELLDCGVDIDNISFHYLPGSLELPYAARQLFESDESLDAIIAFGVVLQGDTTHDSSVMSNVVNGFGIVSDRFNKPIINEVIGVKKIQDAQIRASDKGLEAVFALSELFRWKDSL